MSPVAFFRRAQGLFEDQLAYWHSGNQLHLERAVIADFELDRPFKSCVNCWSGDVNANSQPFRGL